MRINYFIIVGYVKKTRSIDRAGPRGVDYGGALQAKNLNQAAQAVSGGRL